MFDTQPDREKPSVAAQTLNAAFREDIVSPHVRKFESVLASRECCEGHRGIERVEPCSTCLSKCGTHVERKAQPRRADGVRLQPRRSTRVGWRVSFVWVMLKFKMVIAGSSNGKPLSLLSLSPSDGERELFVSAFYPGRRLSDSPLPWAIIFRPFRTLEFGSPCSHMPNGSASVVPGQRYPIANGR
jgi:hypothetical protein